MCPSRQLGHRGMRLWTNSALTAARDIYATVTRKCASAASRTSIPNWDKIQETNVS